MSVLLCLLTALFGFVLYLILRTTKKPNNFPPGPCFLPIIGNSIQLRKEASVCGSQHMVFEKWSEQYNSKILGIKLGNELVVIVLTYPHVHDVHLREVFEGRPDNFFLRLRTMGTRMGITCADGQEWHEHRIFAMKQMRLVGYGRTLMERHIEKEAASLIAYIESTVGSSTYPSEFLAPSVINVLWSLTAGKCIERNDKQLKRLLDLLNRRSKVFDLCGGMLAQFPFLRHIAPDATGYNLIRQLNQELHSFFMETINYHKKRLSNKDIENDFIFSYIREMQCEMTSPSENSCFNENQLIMTILDLFIAGSQTTSNTLSLAVMMLALRSDLQNELFEEISVNIKESGDSFPHMNCQGYYPLLTAFIMEVQRFFHITPITGPRRALWNTTLGGYQIPKNTTILIGLRSVLMDREHWGDPESFRPQRFINEDGKIIKDEYFMPFGQGRRRCLGDTLARACIFSFLVKIIQHYQIATDKDSLPSLDLQAGITLSPKPYKVKFLAR